jgi:cytochrome c-type biogenesis protein CcmH
MIWLALAALALAVAVLLLRPLWRRRAPAARPDADLAFHRDQLAELERDRALGTLTDTQADAARIEVQRRLLAAAAPPPAATASLAGLGWRPRLAFAAPLIGIVLAGSLALYLELGAPGAADVAVDHTERADLKEFTRLIEQLQDKLKANPRDVDGWLLLARSLRTIERLSESAEAYLRALALSGGRPDIASAYGELMIEIAQGTVTPAAQDLFRQALARDAAEPRARFYLGLAKAQGGDAKGALEDWRALAREAPPDAPYLEAVREQMAAVAQQAGLPVPPEAQASAAPPAAGPRGPSAADMAAAQNMSPEDRQKMIRGMVDGLAARLKENPDDVEGWQRLARAYAVLGDTERAREAAAEAAKRGGGATASAAPPAVPPNMPPAAGPQRGPSAADMAAAQSMSPEDRQKMIRGMVDGLAVRLKDNPSDVDGWLRLARAYGVLGEPERARDALGSAAKAAPQRLDVLTAYAQAIYTPERAADQPPQEFVGVMKQILALEPTNPQALWYVGNDLAATGDKKQAAVLLKRLLDRLPPNAPLRSQVQQRLDAVQGG